MYRFYINYKQNITMAFDLNINNEVHLLILYFSAEDIVP